MSIFSGILKSVLIDRAKHALSKENLSPAKTPSTAVAYTSSGALAYLMTNPPGTEHDVILQAVLAIVSAVSFFWKKSQDKSK